MYYFGCQMARFCSITALRQHLWIWKNNVFYCIVVLKPIFLYLCLCYCVQTKINMNFKRHPRSISRSVVLDTEMVLRRLGIWNYFSSSVFMKCQNMFILPRLIAALPCCWPVRRVLWSETSILARYVEQKSQGCQCHVNLAISPW